MNIFNCLSQIAEERIRESIEKGEFDDLPGAGKPLVFEDMSNVPEDLRMAYKILKNAGCLPPELERRKEMANLASLLENCADEKEKIICARKLRALFGKQPERIALLQEKDEYYQQILAKLEKHENNLEPHNKKFE